jgi:hypothetical protein
MPVAVAHTKVLNILENVVLEEVPQTMITKITFAEDDQNRSKPSPRAGVRVSFIAEAIVMLKPRAFDHRL